MVWFAVRTMPGAQVPQREYIVEKPSPINPDIKGFGKKGYRIVPSLNPTVSAVERALTDEGFVHYMPAEKKIIRKRDKTRTWTLRRFPVLHGYIFVHDPVDWPRLTSLPGVAGIVGNCGEPSPISIVDILALRAIEARSEASAEEELSKVIREEEKAARKERDKAKGLAKRLLVPGRRVNVLYGRAIGRQATFIGWEDQERIRVIAEGLEDTGTISLPFDMVMKVA